MTNLIIKDFKVSASYYPKPVQSFTAGWGDARVYYSKLRSFGIAVPAKGHQCIMRPIFFRTAFRKRFNITFNTYELENIN